MGLFAAALPVVGTIASTGLAIYGQRQQAQAATQAAQANTRLAEYNNRLAAAEATNTEAENREGIRRASMGQRAQMAELRARLATSGVRTDTGTASLIPAEAAGRFQLSISDSARAASMEAASMRAKGRMGLWEADQYARATKLQNRSARLQSIGTGISGITSAFGQYSQGRDVGLY